MTDPSLYILKGGVNLRFFFNSPRYSEDMDLDVTGGSVATLKKNGYKLLSDKAFIRSLRTYGIEALDVNDPDKAKHSATQRFRLGLITTAGLRLPTKVEFSRRKNSIQDAPRDLINPDIAQQYNKLSFRCRHYPGEIAALQKLRALAGRTSTQARDVFDFYLLHAGGYAKADLVQSELTPEDRKAAIEATLSLGIAEYQGQVLEFLDEKSKQEFASESAWEEMQDTVLGLLDDNA